MRRFLALPILLLTATEILATESRDLALDALIVDTHIDVPHRLFRNPETDVTHSTVGGDFDLTRAIEGGLNAAFMSIYVPASLEEEGKAKERADALIDIVHGIVAKTPERLAIATCVADIYAQKKAGMVSFPMGMENGGPIEGEMENVAHFRKRGIRYITLAHSKSNHISDSSYDTNERWGGLSKFGKELIPVMNDQGIMVDISHVSDAAAWQVLELSKVPVIASHSSLRHFVPGFERNMTDDMVEALGKNDGVIQINFGSGFVTAEARQWSIDGRAAYKVYQADNALADDAEELKEYRTNWDDEHPYPFAGLSNILDHIDRVVQLAGIDHVGIGSDYDGVGNTLPTDLKDVASYPNLVLGLRARAYSDEDIRKVLGENLMRVWRDVETYATSKGYAPQCSQ
ncbi:MAG: dipeptidase [Pseudomonadales bacterium]